MPSTSERIAEKARLFPKKIRSTGKLMRKRRPRTGPSRLWRSTAMNNKAPRVSESTLPLLREWMDSSRVARVGRGEIRTGSGTRRVTVSRSGSSPIVCNNRNDRLPRWSAARGRAARESRDTSRDGDGE